MLDDFGHIFRDIISNWFKLLNIDNSFLKRDVATFLLFLNFIVNLSVDFLYVVYCCKSEQLSHKTNTRNYFMIPPYTHWND